MTPRILGARSQPTTPEQRTISAYGKTLGYVLRRSSRKSLALQVRADGVRVAAPVRAPVADIESFIFKHWEWLWERLTAETHLRASQRLALRDGCLVPLLGEHCRIRLDAKRKRPLWLRGADDIEEVCLPEASDLAEPLIRALKQRALPYFAERVDVYCRDLGRSAPRVGLSSARTRWGSCSVRSGIRLHWRLIHMSPDLIDYVVAHEVAHLVEMNHSSRFWTIVEKLYPEWRMARKSLRLAGAALPVLGRPPNALDVPSEV